MVMGCLVAFVTAAMLQFQSDAGGTYRRTLNVLVAAITLNGLSLVIFACNFDEHFVRQTLLAIMAASSSFVVGAFSLIFVYRPNFPTRFCWLYSLVCLSGYLV